MPEAMKREKRLKGAKGRVKNWSMIKLRATHKNEASDFKGSEA